MNTSFPKRLTKTALASAIIAATSLGSTVYAANFDVTVANDDGSGAIANTLSWAILQANTVSGADTITLKTNVSISHMMQTLLDSNITLQSDTTPRTINGGNQFRPLFVKSGNVVIKNLTLENGKAAGVDSGLGGGGAGLGGALFVYDGTVLADNVTFNNNNAIGGNHLYSGSKTGGGMFGNVVSGGFGSGGSGGNNGGDGSAGGDGGDGGFGGGGGNGSENHENGFVGAGGDGGFGGRDGRYYSSGSGGSGGYGGGDFSGGGAGFGGAIFAMKGSTTLRDVSFSGNVVTAGTGFEDGSAAGADVFICNSSMDPLCNATVYTQGSTNTTEVVGSLQTWSTVNYDVTEQNDDGTGQTPNTLSWAILQANIFSLEADTITLKTDVTVNGVMKTLLNSDISLQSDGTKRTISGNNQFRPLFVKSGEIMIKNLTLANGKAQGGHSNLGGGGAGLGGALFIYDGNVTIDDVAFTNNNATGGNGGDSNLWMGGGGLFGNGGFGGGGLFAASITDFGAYGGTGAYKANTKFGTGGNLDNSADDGQYGDSGGFGGGGGGGGGYTTYTYGAGMFYGGGAYAGNGGFGGGGGGGGYEEIGYSGSAGSGGFGGGGGTGTTGANPGLGGFGAGAGSNTVAWGGGGAGFGGAIFAMKGTATLINSTFSGNTVTPGTGGNNGTADAKDIFICTSSLHSTAADCSAVVNVCNTETTEVVGTLTPGTDCPVNPAAIMPILQMLLLEE